MSYTITRHAQRRLRQRGLRTGDLELVLQHGTVTDDGVLLTNKDAAAQIAEHHRCISSLERLRGTAVFTSGDLALSAYRPSRAKVRCMIRSRRCSR